jgi:hypothetical protein
VDDLEPIGPGKDLEDFQTQQAVRIRKFLTRLASDRDLLVRYIEDRVKVLRGPEAKKLGLKNEDVALLLSSDYSRVYEVMSKGSQPMRWIVIWIV